MDSGTSRAVAVALALVGAAALVGTGTLTGCGSSNAAGPDSGPPVQDGSADVSQPDASQTDTGTVDASDAGQAVDTGPSDDAALDVDCGAVPPTGTQLVKSTDPVILYGSGTTSDGYAFYEDSTTEILYAVPGAGGTPASLGYVTSQLGTFYLNGGKAVLYLLAATNPVTELAPLNAWSAASGPNKISPNAFAFDSYGDTYDVTADGSYVAYFNSTDGVSATFTVSTIDGKTQTQPVPNIDLTNESCFPVVRFAGEVAVAEYCLAGGSGLTIAAFAAPSFTQVPLAAYPTPTGESLLSPPPFSPDGTAILLPAPSGGLAIYPLSGATPTTVDPLGAVTSGSTSSAEGFFNPAGNVVYVTTTNALRLYTVTSGEDGGVPEGGAADSGAPDASTADGGAEDGGPPDGGGNPLTLVASGMPPLLAGSRDGNWVQAGTGANPPITNVNLASATTPGPLTSLWGTQSAEAIGFTTDSTFQVFLANLPQDFGDTSFDVYASPVSGGKATKILTSAGGFVFTTGSKIVTNVNATATTGGADIEGLDLNSPAVTKTLVTQADPYFFYAPTTNDIFYSWHCAPSAASGVWVVAAP